METISIGGASGVRAYDYGKASADSGILTKFYLNKWLPPLGDSNHRYANFMEFYHQCVVPELADGTKGITTISRSQNLEQDLAAKSTRLVRIRANENDTMGTLRPCSHVAVGDTLAVSCETFMEAFRKKHIGVPIAELSNAKACGALETYSRYALNGGAGTTIDKIIEQRAAINLLKEANTLSLATSGGDPAAISHGSVENERGDISKWMSLGILGKEFLPLTRGVLQAFVIGLFWIATLVSIATASLKPIVGVVSLQLAIIIWSAELAIIHHFTIQNTIEALKGIAGVPNGLQLTLYSSAIIDEKHAKALAYLGFMGSSAFVLAMALVGGVLRVATQWQGSLQSAPPVENKSASGTTIDVKGRVVSENFNENVYGKMAGIDMHASPLGSPSASYGFSHSEHSVTHSAGGASTPTPYYGSQNGSPNAVTSPSTENVVSPSSGGNSFHINTTTTTQAGAPTSVGQPRTSAPLGSHDMAVSTTGSIATTGKNRTTEIKRETTQAGALKREKPSSDVHQN